MEVARLANVSSMYNALGAFSRTIYTVHGDTNAISALKRRRQKVQTFKVILGHRVNSRPAWVI